MNTLKQLAVAAALVAGAVGSVSAAQICSGCTYRFDGDGLAGDTGAAQTMAATYIGTYNPNANFPLGGDLSIGLNHFGLSTSFTDWWAFRVDPMGNADWSMTFNPVGSISNFSSTLYELGNSLSLGTGVGATCTAVTGSGFSAQAGFCGTIGTGDTGTLVASSTANPIGPNQHNLKATQLLGWYIVKVTGDVTVADISNGYSGNITTRPLPEPMTLSLVGAALLGAAAVARRRSNKA